MVLVVVLTIAVVACGTWPPAARLHLNHSRGDIRHQPHDYNCQIAFTQLLYIQRAVQRHQIVLSIIYLSFWFLLYSRNIVS